jgi:hypothetical protein
MDKHKLTIRRTVKELGLQMVALTQGRSHLRVEVTDGQKSLRYTVPLTPSDARWHKNFTSDLRKAFR